MSTDDDKNGAEVNIDCRNLNTFESPCGNLHLIGPIQISLNERRSMI